MGLCGLSGGDGKVMWRDTPQYETHCLYLSRTEQLGVLGSQLGWMAESLAGYRCATLKIFPPLLQGSGSLVSEGKLYIKRTTSVYTTHEQ
jgi:hypothetical protein